jgi:hypothetical protein
MKNLIIVVIIISASYFIFKKDKWLGFYYPDGCLGCSEDYIYSPEFKTKEQCFDWAHTLKKARNNSNDLFECGKNCKLQNSGMYICKETVD